MRILMTGTTISVADASGPSSPTTTWRSSTPPRATPWLRVNMVSTVDGSATGEGGRSGSINNEADERVFHILRGLADAIIVGAGTARAEGYGPADPPLVLVSRSGRRAGQAAWRRTRCGADGDRGGRRAPRRGA